jgi:hypothetical protein
MTRGWVMARHTLNDPTRKTRIVAGNAKGPVSDDGAQFGRSSLGGECSLTPPPSQFVTLSFGSRAAQWRGNRSHIASWTTDGVICA